MQYIVRNIDIDARTIEIEWAGVARLNHGLPLDMSLVASEQGLRSYINSIAPYHLVDRPPVDEGVKVTLEALADEITDQELEAEPLDIGIDALLESKLLEIKLAAETEAGILVSSYPDFEKITWGDQEREALAYQEDPDVELVVLPLIAQARGLDLGDLVSRVLAKAAMYRQAAAQITGKRQALEDAAWDAFNAGDAEALSAISWAE